MADKANIYPRNENNPTISNSNSSKSNIGICFSGGGSRALTCAWGQMLGLKSLNLIDKARYISSVSGGTWASSIYNYLPDKITDDELLGTYYPPKNLSLTDGTGNLNVNNLNKYSLGQAPAGMAIDELVGWGAFFLLTNSSSDYKWFWAYIVGKFVLEPYGLRSEGVESWSSTKYFSLSQSYATNNFPAEAPSIDNFFFLRSGRPFLIINNNIIEKVQVPGKDTPNIVQFPNQVTPVSGGARGQTPNATIIGGGTVESYGYNSTLDQDSADSSPVEVTIPQPYSLIDIVSTSSAFFAATIAGLIETHVKDPKKMKKLVSRVEANLKPEHEKNLLAKAKRDFSDILDIPEIIEKYLGEIIVDNLSLGSIIPSYNYWPIGKVGNNRKMEYTDGGTLDNTGVIGMLSQTDTGSSSQDPINLVVFDNTETPLKKKNGHIIAASQIAPLFGIDFDTSNGTYQPFTDSQKDPNKADFEATSLTTVFNNNEVSPGNTPFSNLLKGLYAASCGASSEKKSDNSKVNTEPAFYQIDLITVHNPLANVTAGRRVNIIYIQNAKIMNWQNQIGDEKLKKEIVEGQKKSIDPFNAFKNFPYYSTGFKIGLEAKESNALSQMWAWAIADDSSPLKNQLQTFIDNASS